MSRLAGHYMATRNPLGQKPGKVSNRIKIPLHWLVAPSHGYGIYGLHTAVACEVFRWLVKAGDNMRSVESRWGSAGPRELLSLTSCVNMREDDSYSFATDTGPFVGFETGPFMQSLAKRFLHAAFDAPRTQAVVDWRKKVGLDSVYRAKVIPVRYYAPMWSAGPLSSMETEKAINRLFAIRNRKLAKSWNSCHKKARWAHYATLQCRPEGWRVWIRYGYKEDSSCWRIDVAEQRADEVFSDFIVRANRAMESLFEPRKEGLAA